MLLWNRKFEELDTEVIYRLEMNVEYISTNALSRLYDTRHYWPFLYAVYPHPIYGHQGYQVDLYHSSEERGRNLSPAGVTVPEELRNLFTYAHLGASCF